MLIRKGRAIVIRLGTVVSKRPLASVAVAATCVIRIWFTSIVIAYTALQPIRWWIAWRLAIKPGLVCAGAFRRCTRKYGAIHIIPLVFLREHGTTAAS
jgi:hypothetical protein